jgi:hypothetical protein
VCVCVCVCDVWCCYILGTFSNVGIEDISSEHTVCQPGWGVLDLSTREGEDCKAWAWVLLERVPALLHVSCWVPKRAFKFASGWSPIVKNGRRVFYLPSLFHSATWTCVPFWERKWYVREGACVCELMTSTAQLVMSTAHSRALSWGDDEKRWVVLIMLEIFYWRSSAPFLKQQVGCCLTRHNKYQRGSSWWVVEWGRALEQQPCFSFCEMWSELEVWGMLSHLDPRHPWMDQCPGWR